MDQVHGSVRELVCLECGQRYPRARLDELTVDDLPRCPCGAVLKPAVVLFEEMLPEQAVEQSLRAISDCDLLLVIGSSMVVYPVAAFPGDRPPGSRMAIINERTSWCATPRLVGGDIAEQCGALSAVLRARAEPGWTESWHVDSRAGHPVRSPV